MGYFSKKQMEALKPYEQYLASVYVAQFKRTTSIQENNAVADVWAEYTGTPIKKVWACSNCVYTLYRNVAQVYFATLAENKKGKEDKKAPAKKSPKKTTKKVNKK